MIIKKDSKIVKAKGERKSIALKAKKESSDEESLTFRIEDKEYAIVVRDFKKFFKRRGRFVRQPLNDKKTFQRIRDDKKGKSDRKCYRCEDPNHLIRECPKPLRDKNQREFVGGSWSDSGEEDDKKNKDEKCLMAQASSEMDTYWKGFIDSTTKVDMNPPNGSNDDITNPYEMQSTLVCSAEPGDVIEVVEKISCNFPLLCVAFVAIDTTLSLVNLNSKIPLKYDV
ncbi:alpha/beta hydrolases superfamily protein [Tanacetum coccineum]|uniref:Alpha/beta hydrolases superfamily protein n=1 Tax=Tanacetum coccineum TaxID=301880 RepID=A0ABQ5EXC8_9ASTR